MIEVKKGLDLPITGAPEQRIEDAQPVRHVAILGTDYVGMKPTMEVQEGDKVKLGQLLFTDKKIDGVRFTAPAGGEVVAINRGEKRRLLSVVIKVDENEEAMTFASHDRGALGQLDRQAVVDQLVESGLWTALRTRPFSRTPAIDSVPADIFVTAVDTHPLSADPAFIINENAQAFEDGLKVLTRLTEGNVFLCTGANASIPGGDVSGVKTESFAGPHPAGLVGTHIHYLSPVALHKKVWHIGYQDVIAFGKLFVEGKLDTSRIVAVGGPRAEKPRILRTRVGASTQELLAGEVIKPDDTRVISGSVFSGAAAEGKLTYLGRFHNQISLLEEGNKRTFMGWLSLGANRHSVMGIYLSKFKGLSNYAPTTSTNGSERAMVPVGNYERVMPLDIMPTQLLRSLIVGDIEVAMQLGCLELDEEDLALCTYVCPGKYEYGPILRDNLTMIEKEA
ncbi:MAG: Na(+)-translocating NADH-quinone reductase subunit A, partial [Pseudomonadota bacterium]|jgi:Na+-transporting NADH:ubiquinone oxidoreductase subunit A|uniref:Na(+)-translocating NADH-quinone reductase subunit A n=1 Tax=Vreelandella aquamarina TaxID=77097 RepID=A0A1N6DW52_9GAMM|nr:MULTISPECIES: Na(+)-translocating NADH-quinone reductase subunit A [Halomonas]MEC8937192.1 Na(+)-translocating NADH-quinone reductase subunit A [Pseudomonadota bacterium]HAO01034.1 Na(+)-translocating NADH-quinone reductase subunit A [Halomonas sp.]MCO7241647.1 Na(+)-translocating NADH-quinone reductase subunit A [Halomonas sp. Ps84H-12]SIN63207.1 Na+-transporting NADH:ubiquinone oxidoreductase subunit A [Halomonas meridiana]SIN74980.1 Na+-transporting NADH:ubiquinone oxidoreductase subunit|tara:strand:- start:1133 stop:2482 length:1350 start_codon:yes stop_codon:yes gene_type:complete